MVTVYKWIQNFNFRAVYQNKEVYLIDDIFSAVDVPVGVHIYKKCIQGLLKEKTRILCTHHPRFLASANQVSFTLKSPPPIKNGSVNLYMSCFLNYIAICCCRLNNYCELVIAHDVIKMQRLNYGKASLVHKCATEHRQLITKSSLKDWQYQTSEVLKT